MRLPSCSFVMTINERPTEVMAKVLESLPATGLGVDDELIIVLDRTPQHLKDWLARHTAFLPLRPTFVEVPGEPGWLCPARAWNAGYSICGKEITYSISSEVIQLPANVTKAKQLLATTQGVIFGHAVESEPDKYGHSVAGGVLCSSDNPRPLGFIMAMPTWMLRTTGGMDEGFMGGYWYDDDDFTYRLWRLGLPFIFTDQIRGVHQSHPRPVLDTKEGKDGIARNAAYITAKWGKTSPLVGEPMSHVHRQDLTIWFPHQGPGLLDARVKAWDLPVGADGKVVKVVH